MTLKLPEEDVEFQIARLELRPGDVLVARAMRPMTSEASQRIKAALERALPIGTKVLVIDAGLDLSVASKSDAKRLANSANG